MASSRYLIFIYFSKHNHEIFTYENAPQVLDFTSNIWSAFLAVAKGKFLELSVVSGAIKAMGILIRTSWFVFFSSVNQKSILRKLIVELVACEGQSVTSFNTRVLCFGNGRSVETQKENKGKQQNVCDSFSWRHGQYLTFIHV